ncbi:MAG: thioredoxin family protein [Dehalococcoidia bacterium]|nr:thioredoxin family protein [Dehalococcoidia bacterium]
MTATSTITRKASPAKPDSVVTPERFAQGLDSFASWQAAIEKNKETFERHYNEWEPDQADVDAIKALVSQHGLKALVLGEDWCPDVWRGLPVAARLGELTGMEVRFFPRDENKDIMAEFLKDGEFESIPTIVLYDRDHNYLGHWIERSDLANSEMGQLREIMAGKERDTPEWEEARKQYQAKTWDFAEGWRDSQVAELRALVEEALS